MCERDGKGFYGTVTQGSPSVVSRTGLCFVLVRTNGRAVERSFTGAVSPYAEAILITPLY